MLAHNYQQLLGMSIISDSGVAEYPTLPVRNERNNVAIGIADVKIGSAPGLFG